MPVAMMKAPSSIGLWFATANPFKG
jgi:hypothetical protein